MGTDMDLNIKWHLELKEVWVGEILKIDQSNQPTSQEISFNETRSWAAFITYLLDA